MKNFLYPTLHWFVRAIIFIFILTSNSLYSQYDKLASDVKVLYEGQIDDGPYIEILKKNLNVAVIKDGEVITKEIPKTAINIKFKPEASIYKGVSKIAAFSDLHGQYDLSLKLLEKNKIIDKKGDWNFGDGHLVIVGDIFDRGDKVTDILWFLFKLEKQAFQQNGKVHYLLGNHEYMIFQKDLRHINKKYKKTSKLLNTTYTDLFGKNTVLGRWLRSKSTIVKINDVLYVHGGISPEFVNEAQNLGSLNSKMRKSIDIDIDSKKFQNKYEKYFLDNSPVWYRGYFKDSLTEGDIDELLLGLNVNKIVVGHTSQNSVKSLFSNKIFVVDSSIKNGKKGQLLFIENGVFSKGTLNGNRKQFN
ncbi:metallophosphoesterase [Maribacter sp. 1_MG-2023]|uniref:metallophosphoesterase n=1 Tax=Maribacter sp. 1_MG-2023 TaxID=3062677 RepID=UPI0026E38EBC|nr:metallophosphoesterase [Maribacter sp. 1_MG-2023]MDO6472750.1 metallophosphoesterase [Maribacter sp. 1_MG-2023]